MKILLCTKYDLVGSMMLNLILPRIADQHTVSVVLANRRRPEAAAIPTLRWMKLFEQDLPAWLLFPLLDAQSPSPDSLEPPAARWLSFSALARRYRAPMINAGHIAEPGVLTGLVREAAPDVLVSFQFGFIFRAEALAAPALGAMNMHSGPLPGRAGNNPTFWCMKDGAPETACTLHWMDTGIDTGPVIASRPMALDYSRSFFANWIRNYRNGAELIGDAIEALARGETLPAIPQDAGARRYAPTPTPEDFAAFCAAGGRMIDPDDYLTLMAAYLCGPSPIPSAIGAGLPATP